MSIQKVSSSWATRTERSGCYRDIRILVVDCDHICLNAVSGMLRDLSYEVLMADRGREALAAIRDKETRVEIVLTELHLPDMYGLDLLDQIKRTSSELPILIMSADGSEESMLRSLQKGAEFYFRKPVLMEELTNIWQYVFVRRLRRLKLESLIEEEDEGSAAVNGGKDAVDGRKEAEEEEEEDTPTSPSRKKARLNDDSCSPGTAGGGLGLCAYRIEEEQFVPPPPTTPQDQRMVKASEAEAEDDYEPSDAAAKGGKPL